MKAPPLPDRSCALFLDFDGTLVDIAPQPDAVRVAAQLPLRLALLSVALDGALAIVSGRPAAQIDAFMQPARFCLAGVHGTERRGPDGVLRRLPAPDLSQARDLIEAFCHQHSGLLLETKPGALALHYRQAPALEQACLAVMQQAQQLAPGMDLLCGKKVMELKPEQAGKGHAVRAFLREPPFLHRQPWYVGDDVTDEAAFEAVLALGGVAVKVGAGASLAPFRLPDPTAVRGWLDATRSSFGTTHNQESSP